MRRLILLAGLLVLGVAVSASPAAVTLNLRGAEIDALIATVADATGRNFIVDPRVAGKVTVVSARPLEPEALYDAFLAVLQVHGYAAVPAGDMVKIVPDVAATTAAGSTAGRADEVVTRVIAVDNVPATQLVPILRPLLPQAAHLAANPASNTLVVADSAANVERIAAIVGRVDQPAAEMEVIALSHASAAEVARVLSALTKGSEAGPARVVPDERTNSLLVSGGPETRLRLRTLITHLDTPLDARSDTTHVVYLRYARAEELAPLLTGVSQNLRGVPAAKREAAAAGDGGLAPIQADAGMNALVVSAEPAEWRTLEGVIRQLDQPRAQVLVEAIIVEVSTDLLAELGVQWRGTAGFDDDRGVIGGTSFSAGGQAINGGPGGINNPRDIGDGLAVGFLDGVRRVLGTNVSMGALLRALKSNADTNVLSTPSLVTLDNAEAEIIVGQNVPFLTGSFTSPAADGDNPFQTIEREDVGLKLLVRPQINEGDAVRMEIAQEVSSIAPSSLGADLITNKRAIKTTVLVDDGRILVLGGLIDAQQRITFQRVPVLGHLPMVGGLFNYQQADNAQTNLMVFIRPRILRDARTAEAYSGEKYNLIRAQQLEALSRSRGYTGRATGPAPLLPEIELDAVPPVDAHGAH